MGFLVPRQCGILVWNLWREKERKRERGDREVKKMKLAAWWGIKLIGREGLEERCHIQRERDPCFSENVY